MMRRVGFALGVVAALGAAPRYVGAAPVGRLKPAPTTRPAPAYVRGAPTYVGAGFSRPAIAAPTLGDITTLADFQAMFDAGRATPRIVLLLSPT